MSEEILRVEGLSVYFHTSEGAVKAADDVSFALRAHERLGLVGESGSGKSTVTLALMRLIKPPGKIERGDIVLDEINLARLSEDEMRAVRLEKMALIPQGSMNSLNPVLRVRDHMAENFKDHGVTLGRSRLAERTRELLEWVGLQPGVAGMYPHELSGGMKQRVCIALSICLRPKVIIADEPTSALDVVVQKQVMSTLIRVQKDLDASVILVGHDMGLMAKVVDRLGVMYAGHLVEVAPAEDLFTRPLHPYTKALIASLPSLDEKGDFVGMPGLPPLLRDLPPGCAFAPRCAYVKDICRMEYPMAREARPDNWVACHCL